MAGNPHKAEASIAMDSTDAIIVDILEHDGRATLTRLAKADCNVALHRFVLDSRFSVDWRMEDVWLEILIKLKLV